MSIPKSTVKAISSPGDISERAVYVKAGAGGLRSIVFFTNNSGHKLQVIGITERHGTAEVTTGTLTATVKKVPSGTAVGSGTSLHGTGINLKGTADTNANPTLSATLSDLKLNDGDSLGVVFSAAGTEIADLEITVLLQAIKK